jgi:F-box protein 9
LARFREEWKADLNQRLKRAEDTYKHPQPTELTPVAEPSSSDATGPTVPKRTTVKPVSPTGADANTGPSRGPGFTIPLTPAQTKALDIYKRAIAHEQKSELDDALRLYRQAFRIHEDIARLYERIENQQFAAKPIDPATTTQLHRDHKLVPIYPVVRLTQDMEKLHVSTETAVSLPANHGIVTGTLTSIVASWGSLVLAFEPEDEKQPVHLQRLPDELLVHLLEYLDTTMLEQFALVNRKARILTLDAVLWR